MTSAIASRPVLTPKALLYQKYGSKACYRIEEVLQSCENVCPGLAIPQQGKYLYKCHLDLPDLSVTSDTFPRKKDAEQSAAKIAIEKLGIQSILNNLPLTQQELWNELVARLSFLFSDKFLSSSHPLIGHFRAAFEREDKRYGLVPLSVIAACDSKICSLCKSIDPLAEFDPVLMTSLAVRAARSSPLICIQEGELWAGKQHVDSLETIWSVIGQNSVSAEGIILEAISIPILIEKPVETMILKVPPKEYYVDAIALKLGGDSSRVLVSRTVGKASSEMRIYFLAPDCLLSLDSMLKKSSDSKEHLSEKQALNQRASYLAGQNIYGDAVMATVGYSWKSSGLFHEHITLSAYYRMLINRVPVGSYKLSRDSILVAELPTTFTTRLNWRGSLPRDLLSMFCRHHWLSEPLYNVETISSLECCPEILETGKLLKSTNLNEHINFTNGEDNNGSFKEDSNDLIFFRCEVKILTRQQDKVIEYSPKTVYRKHNDAVQDAALKVFSWLNKYFEQLDLPVEQFCASAPTYDIYVNIDTFSKVFELCPSVHGVQQGTKYSLTRTLSVNQQMERHKNEFIFNIEGTDSGASPSLGSLVCISYVVELVNKADQDKYILESKEEFEFEIGTCAVIYQLEACVTQMSVNQFAKFTLEMPSAYLILSAAGETAKHLLQLSPSKLMLEYFVKVLRATEPLEDRIEQAFFTPPLSKQRVEFAIRCINRTHATSLVDFGCGSGSLLDSLLEHTTTLEKIVGVDISRRSLTRAAKLLHSKISSKPLCTSQEKNIRSMVLYDGSITNFDSRLYGLDIGICLEVIEHMEMDQASLFGETVLACFCPKLLVVSTPNYEYNPILQRNSFSSKDEDPVEKSYNTSCKFRNHDHKFEWTRKQFQDWATDLAPKHSYHVEFSGVGGSGDIEPGFASQIAVFRQIIPNREDKGLRIVESSHPYEVIWEWHDIPCLDPLHEKFEESCSL